MTRTTPTAALTNLSGATTDTLMGLLAADVTASPAFTATTAANEAAYKAAVETFKAATTIKAVNAAMLAVDGQALATAKATGIGNTFAANGAVGAVVMPNVGAGYTIAVKTSSPTDYYDADGKLVADGVSTVVYTVTHTASGKTADTGNVTVTVDVTP